MVENHNMIENQLVILTKQTIDVFLKQDNPADLIALYTFYYYTAKWQSTNQIRCTTGYVANGLKWSEAKVRKAKSKLIELGVIEDIQARDSSNKIIGHYIKMNYIIKQSTVSEIHTNEIPQGGKEENHPNDFAQGGNPHRVENHDTNALSNDNINALNNNNINALSNGNVCEDKKKTLSKILSDNKKKKSASRFQAPTLEEVREYCIERNNNVDSERFIDYYTANGWKVGKNSMKDWKAAVRTWERNGYSNGNISNNNIYQNPTMNNSSETNEDFW